MNAALLITAMMLFGGTQLPGEATTSTTTVEILSQERQKQEKEKEEIRAEDLPEAVKGSIAQHSEVRALPISKAYKMKKDDGNVYYHVEFGQGEETMSKKFKSDGTEITD